MAVKRFVFLVGFLLVFGLFVYFFVLRYPSSKPRQVSELPVQPETPAFGTKIPEKGVNIAFPESDFEVSLLPDPILAIFEALGKSVFVEQPDSTKPIFDSESTAEPPAGGQVEPLIHISEKELFDFAYPAYYKEVLHNFNMHMIKRGFVDENRIYPLTSMPEAVALQDKFADYLETAANLDIVLSKTDLDKYRRSYRELLPKLWADELKTMKAARSTSFLPLKFWYEWRLARIRAQKNSLLHIWHDEIIPTAYAKECYREGVPNLNIGRQLSAVCCDCEDGGLPIGCKNDVCANKPMIWDSSTSICGCDI